MRMKDGSDRNDRDHAHPRDADGVAPGKRTLTGSATAVQRSSGSEPNATGLSGRSMSEIIPLSSDVPFADSLVADTLVQRKETGGASDADVHALADHGTSGAAGALPFMDQIQRSFGNHDVSSIKAHDDGAAVDASRAMGARAFASGDHVAFGASPDLHTAAHEAAHVVQQRGGVQLAGGVGSAGDPYERHADAVADAVVRGEPAAPLLDSYAAAGGGSTVQRSSVQLFEEREHKSIGDQGARGANGVTADMQFGSLRLTFGDMVAMAGDWFESIEEMRALAERPGPGAGTEEELRFVQQVKVRGNKNLEDSFSPAAKDAVQKRYYKLAGNNVVHFPNAAVGDAEKKPAERARDGMRFPKGTGLHGDVETIVKTVFDRTGGADALPGLYKKPLKPELLNAAAAYRYYHIRALVEAAVKGNWDYDKAVHGPPQDSIDPALKEQMKARQLDGALSTEAFGNHFLTDMFSGGHVRAERASIKAYWNAKLPMFFYNLKGFIAEQVARGLQGKVDIAGIELDSDTIYDPPLGGGAMDIVTERLDAIGPLGWGELVSGIVHDHDGAVGVKVTSEGQDGELRGDGDAGKKDEESLAIRAVSMSYHEVLDAYRMGRETKARPEDVVNGFVKEGLFAAERTIPVAKPDAEQGPSQKRIQWHQPDVEVLLQDPVFLQGLRDICVKRAGEVAAIADTLDADQKAAMLKNVIAPLRERPIETVRGVIHWVPTLSRELTLGYTQTARKTEGGMASLSLAQRVQLLAAHVTEAENADGPAAEVMRKQGPEIIELIKTASKKDRKMLFSTYGWVRLHRAAGAAHGDRFEREFPRSVYGP